MKRLGLVLLAIMLLASPGCDKDDDISQDKDNPGITEDVEFLAYYKPGAEKVLGSDKKVALISVNNGELTYSTYLNAYPESGMIDNCDINNNLMVLGLDESDFNNKGAYMNLDDPEAYFLPLIEPSGNNDYSYFQTTTGDVSDNGYIFYSDATNDISYGDEYKPYLMRFNPSDGTLDMAISANSFVASQPERTSDTEVGQITRTIFASPDGRYAYGQVDALGTDGGAIHWDYEILYKYDFDNQQYTRLGASDDDDVSIKGMTSDRRYILYTNHGTAKLLDINSGNITETDVNLYGVNKNTWGTNGACVGSSNGNLYNRDFVNNKEYLVCSAPGYGGIYNTMFSKNGNYIYFLLEGDNENYLCVTNGIEEGSSYDTISPIPLEFEDMVMVK